MDIRHYIVRTFQLLLLTYALILSGCSAGVQDSSTSNNSLDNSPPPPTDNNATPSSTESNTTPILGQANLSKIADPEDYGPFNDYALRAKTSYDGVVENQPLTLDSASEFLTQALLGHTRGPYIGFEPNQRELHWVGMTRHSLFRLPLVEIERARATMPLPGTYHCGLEGNKNGTMVVSNNVTYEENSLERWRFEIDYDNCAYSYDSYYTGKLLVEYVRGTGVFKDVYIAYDNISITNAKGKYQITGAASLLNPAACKLEGKKRYYVTIKNMLNSDTLLYANFSTAIDKNGPDCTFSTLKPNYFEGKVFNGRYGTVSVETNQALPFNLETRFGHQKTINTHVGMVTIESGDDNIQFTIDRHPERELLIDHHDYVSEVTLALNFPSTGIEKTFTQLATHFQYGGFSNLKDNDEDGMLDGWEMANGLNDVDPGDAGSDIDGDSVSALMEYLYLGDPNQFQVRGAVLDRKVELTDRTGPDQTKIKLNLSEGSANHGYKAKDVTYKVTVTASVSGTWSDVTGFCAIEAANNSVICEQHPGPHANSHNFSFIPDVDGTTVFNASSDVPVNDAITTNNADTLSVEFLRPNNISMLEPEPDLNIRPDPVIEPDFNIEPATNIEPEPNIEPDTTVPSDLNSVDPIQLSNNYMLQSEASLIIEPDAIVPLKLNIEEQSVDTLSEFHVTITHPPQISIVSAELEGLPHEFLSTDSCDIQSALTTVTCITRNTLFNHPTSIALEVKTTEIGKFDIHFKLAPAIHETDLSDNEFTTTILSERSTAALQSLIDNANFGDTVVLPAGEFVGELSLRRKPLTVVGADAENPTILRTAGKYKKGLFDIADNSTIRNIHFKVNSWPIEYTSGNNLTIENNVFTSDDGDQGNQSFSLINSGYGDRRDASYRFVNNRVINFGAEGKLACSSLLPIAGWRNVYVERNIFAGNNCIAVFDGEHAEGTYDENAYIGNNTFVDVPKLFSHRIHPLSLSGVTPYVFNMTFENNILQNVDVIFSDSTLYMFNEVNAYFTSASNLHFGNDRTTTTAPSMLAIGKAFVASLDLSADPLFTDALAGDYTLSSASPAIDTGTVPTMNYMGAGFNGEPVYVDGSGDGVALPDIGMFEYLPSEP